MQSSRRKFIKTSAVFAAGVSLMPRSLFASPKKIQRLGLQLYTVRDAMHSDPAGTLKKLSEAGFKHLEHAGYSDRKFYGYEVKAFKKLPLCSSVSFSITLSPGIVGMLHSHLSFEILLK